MQWNIEEKAIEKYALDLIILDIMMPKKDGWSLLRKIKSKYNIPVIITTAKSDEEDRIFGLGLGADDYMVKPISMRKLVLRVNLRIKNNIFKQTSVLSFENMIIDEKKRQVTENLMPIYLTPKEFDLLFFFCQNPNQVFKRQQLLENVWGAVYFCLNFI